MFLKRINLAFLLLAVMFQTSCLSDSMEKKDAQQDVLVASLYKQAECGSAPWLPLPVLKDQDTNAVAGCVMAIVDASCPFNAYPLLCVRIFQVDVPGTVKISK